MEKERKIRLKLLPAAAGDNVTVKTKRKSNLKKIITSFCVLQPARFISGALARETLAAENHG